jgi:hypothetical protein
MLADGLRCVSAKKGLKKLACGSNGLLPTSWGIPLLGFVSEIATLTAGEVQR